MKTVEMSCDSCGCHIELAEQNTNSAPTAVIAKQDFDLCAVCGALLLLALKDHTLRKRLQA